MSLERHARGDPWLAAIGLALFTGGVASNPSGNLGNGLFRGCTALDVSTLLHAAFPMMPLGAPKLPSQEDEPSVEFVLEGWFQALSLNGNQPRYIGILAKIVR